MMLQPHAMPTLAIVLNLWTAGRNTQEIARELRVAESVIYNMLSRVSR
jgi:DNA-binding CsgD family transcriptional regulator